MAKLSFSKGPPLLKVDLQELGDAEIADCATLLRDSPSVLLQFYSNEICTEAVSCIWECHKELTEDSLLLKLPPSISNLVSSELDDNYFPIDFEFLEDFTHLAKCHYAIECYKKTGLEYLLFPSNQIYYPHTKSFTCQSPPEKWSTELNPQQESAMQAILLSDSVLPVIIAGPFGTGKTFLLSQAAEYLVKCCQDSFILVCALNNSSADVYLDNFHKIIPSNCDCKILRLTYKGRIVTTIQSHLHKYCLFDSPSHQTFCYPSVSEVQKYRIIVTTVGMAQELLKLNLTGHFTHIFIDEAAQMTVPEVMMALSLASNITKVVMAGDHMQVSLNYVRSHILLCMYMHKVIIDRKGVVKMKELMLFKG